MKKQSRSLISLILSAFLFLPALFSCGGSSSFGESVIVVYDNMINNGGTWKNYEINAESFTFRERVNPNSGNTKEIDRTGYRIVMRDTKTGIVKSPCIDPLCTHEIDSRCPMVSRDEYVFFSIVGNRLFVNQYGNNHSSDPKDHGMLNSFFVYDLESGEYDAVFSDESYEGVIDFVIGDDSVWYLMPEVRDKKTVYSLVRYRFVKKKSETVAEYDKNLYIVCLTDTRLYFSVPGDGKPFPGVAGVFSTDYNGQNSREESVQFARAVLMQETFFLARVWVDDMFQSPHFVFHDLLTGEEHEIPPGECASGIGYNVSDGRIYYISSRNADAAFTPITWLKRASELGITLNELYKIEEEYKILNEETENALFNEKMYLKSCKTDGSDVKTHFEYPEGAFFEGGHFYSSRTGNVSPDGRWFRITENCGRGDNADVIKNARINIATGEIEILKNGK